MDIKIFIEEHIPQMDSPEKVYQLFEGLGYKILDTSYRGKEAWGLREKDSEVVEEIYTIANYNKRFQVFLVKLKNPSSSIIRELPLYFERETQYPFFVLTPDYQNYTFVLVEKIREDVGVWKRKLIKLNMDRENAFYTDKLVLTKIAIEGGLADPSNIYQILKEALSVEKVSKIFFEDYKNEFFKVRDFLLKQGINIKQAHEFSQQLLNRIMFIYFIDRKKWLENSPKFMKWFWNRYKEEKKINHLKNEFYDKWLTILFLEAFNNRFSHPHYLPKDVMDALALAPYLNGGLFKRNELDSLYVSLPDDFIESILQFFEKYNFTIREDLPLEVEVAVDPQMIGYVYESLANVAEEIYERQDLGIFYTPKIEVDFMCRRSLLEYLYKSTGINKETLYALLFDETKENVEKLLTSSDYEHLEETLDSLSVVDPACGSGAFLVGMLNVLVELYKFIYTRLKRDMTDYQLKKRIIGNSLYGVDIMPWAVHSAELRLWLSLMIESDLTLGDLRLFPLLPNLNLKLRIGDSLVQEIGGISLNLRDSSISPSLKRKLSDLKREKEKYYNNDPTAKFKTEEGILYEELRIFHNILDEKIVNFFREKQLLGIKPNKQPALFEREKPQERLFDEKKLQEQIENKKRKIDAEIERLREIKSKLKEQKPFVWDIDFAEIFGEKGGFDIVIGNPPYVRQEKIAPPNRLRSEISNEEKREYKDKLLKSVRTQFPLISKIDRKSDYYVYFYFHGLSLLNDKGTFCFITSNSWLDVGYGKELQYFLLEYVPIISIYDNQAKRSFEHADVNTIIALFKAPYKTRKTLPALQNRAKFVTFKKPFDQAINTENLLAIEKTEDVLTTDDFRVYPKEQKQLLEEGWEYPEEMKEEQKKLFQFKIGKYAGNKWGGKYLRAPNIYFKLTGMHDIFAPLIEYVDIRYGIKTGLTEFFYFDFQKQKEWNVEDEFLIPFITSTQELENYVLHPKKSNIKLFVCNETKAVLRRNKKNALQYIEWGEKQKTKKGAAHTIAGIPFPEVPSVKGNSPWYSIEHKKHGDFAMAALVRQRYFFAINPFSILVSNMFYQGSIRDIRLKKVVWAGLNSTVTYFFQELLGRPNIGGRLNFYGPEFNQLLIPNPKLLLKNEETLGQAFEKLSLTKIDVLSNELKKTERIILDDLIRISLGLPESLWDEMVKTFVDLINKRTSKELSL